VVDKLRGRPALGAERLARRMRWVGLDGDETASSTTESVISQKVPPRGFSKPFHHPEVQRSVLCL